MTHTGWPAGDVRAVSPISGLRRRRLGLLPVTMQSVSATAPAAAIATVPAMILDQAGRLTVPVLAAVVLLVLAVVHCITAFARRMAAVGGLYSYVAKGVGPQSALVTALFAVVGYAAVSAAALLAVGVYAGELLAPLGLRPGAAVVLASLGGGALVVLLGIRGIRVAALFSLVAESVSIVLILVVLLVLAAGTPGVPSAWGPPDAGPAGMSALAVGGLLALAGFVGFESATTLSSEAARPFLSVPRAVRWTPALIGALYLVATLVQAPLLERDPGAAASAAPLVVLARSHGLPGAQAVLEAAIASSFLACTIASTNALVRVVFCLAREGVLPARLGTTHQRHQTPAGAVRLVGPSVAAVPVLLTALGLSQSAALNALLVVSACGYLGSYVGVCVAAPVFLRRIGEWSPWTLAAAVTGTAGLVVATGVALGASTVTRLGVLGTAAVAGVWLLVVRTRYRDRLGAIGLYDEATADDLLRLPVP